MSKPKRSEAKVKLQNWVSAGQAEAIKEYLKGGALQVKAEGGDIPGNAQGVKINPEWLKGAGQPIEECSVGLRVAGVGIFPTAQQPFDLWEQLAMQTRRADDLQVQVDEQQHMLDRKEVELEELMQVGGTERQSAYIARLLAKVVALGGDKKEFDQT